MVAKFTQLENSETLQVRVSLETFGIEYLVATADLAEYTGDVSGLSAHSECLENIGEKIAREQQLRLPNSKV